MSKKFKQGFFKPKYPEKYRGDVTEIVYRSSWELNLFVWLDNHRDVEWWNSECTVIQYTDPLDTNKKRRYFPDVLLRKTNGETILIEVKPDKETKQPDRDNGFYKNGKPKKTYVTESLTYVKNRAKWAAAEAYCAKKGWKFVILTEYDLGIKRRPSA